MRIAGLALALLLVASRGASEIAVLTNGQTLKIASHRVEGDTVYLSLMGGGEVGTPASTVRGFVPDEVLDEIGTTGDASALRTLAIDTARRHGLDPDLVLAVVAVESAFRPDAVSARGAQGLMQLMPRTASELGVKDALDPAENLDGGTRYLLFLLTLYDGDLEKALAAYNAGLGAVSRHRGVPPYRETQAYVKKVLERYRAKQRG
jgi:hypothetical protein